MKRIKYFLVIPAVVVWATLLALAQTDNKKPDFPSSSPDKKGPKEYQLPGAKGGPMVFVPAGEFIMGMDADDGFRECKKYHDDCKRDWFTDEEPVHKVYLDAFYIDKYEVTQSEYNECVKSGKCKANEKFDGFTGSRQPVVGVDWTDANNFCSWSGKRLPTDAEWEKSARGTDGRMYPWGNRFDGSLVNFCDKNCTKDWAIKKFNDGYSKTSPVGSYPGGVSPYGALDMAGNVYEWVADWYDEDYYKNSPSRNPSGPSKKSSRVLRGGSWNDRANGMRASNRAGDDPADRLYYRGFRCARD